MRGRPLKDGLNYFSFDVDFFDDEKLFDLQDRYGPLGEVIYMRLLCLIYKNGYYYRFQSFDTLCAMLIRSIGSRWVRGGKQLVAQVIPQLVECNLFDKELYESGVLTSVGIQRRYLKATERRRGDIDKYRLLPLSEKSEEEEALRSAPENAFIDDNNSIIDDNNSITERNNATSKVNKNNITTTTTVPACVPEKRAVENRGGPVENSVEPPSWTEVYLYMRSYTDIDPADVSAEADAFMARNAVYKWKCLPDWKAAVELWAARIKCPRN